PYCCSGCTAAKSRRDRCRLASAEPQGSHRGRGLRSRLDSRGSCDTFRSEEVGGDGLGVFGADVFGEFVHVDRGGEGGAGTVAGVLTRLVYLVERWVVPLL